LHGLGELERRRGNLRTANELLERSSELARAAGANIPLTAILHSCGEVALSEGDPIRAARLYGQALQLADQLSYSGTPLYCMAGLAAAAAVAGDVERAGRLWGAIATLERGAGQPLLDPERTTYESIVQTCADAAPIVFSAAVAQGRRTTTAEAVAYALTGG
jgi:hypothetical protein